VCLNNSKQLFHNQTVLMTSHYFDFDAVTHSIKDVSVSTINRLLLPNCSGFMGKSRINAVRTCNRISLRSLSKANLLRAVT